MVSELREQSVAHDDLQMQGLKVVNKDKMQSFQDPSLVIIARSGADYHSQPT